MRPASLNMLNFFEASFTNFHTNMSESLYLEGLEDRHQQ